MSGVEILGIAAGVVQIAELGGKLSVKLFTFTRKIKNADRHIDSISQDIAATGAVLQQLGNELKKDEKLRLCSPEAIATARSLMEECHRIFKELDDAVDGKGKGFGSGTKVILGLRQRLKYPFLEPQIEMLKANLEKLKSSLLVMLNVLILAEQLKNQEALPILKDQRELLKSLVEEKIASQNQYDLVLKRLDQLTVGNEVSSISSLSKETTRTTDSSSTLVNSSSMLPEASAPTDIGSLLPSLPGHLHHRAEEIFDHCRLINTVLEEVHHTQYKLDLGIRYRTQEMILDSHYNEWVGQVDAPRYDAYGNHLPPLYEFLESTPQLKRHWERKKQQDRRHQQQIQARQERLRQMQMTQQAQMPQQSTQAQPVMQQQQAYQAAYPRMDPGTLRARQAAMQAQSQSHMQADQTGLAEVPPQAQPLRPFQQQQQQQGQHQHGRAYQRQQGIRAMYDPRDPEVLATVPTTPTWPTPFGSVAQPSPIAPPPQSRNEELQDYQTKLMLSEGRNRKRLMMAQQAQNMPAGPPHSSADSGVHALQDYQMQIMLLEQQNKKRLMMARQEQDELSDTALEDEIAPGTAYYPATDPASSNMPRFRPSSKRRRALSKMHTPVERSKSSNHDDLTPTDDEDNGPQTQLDPSEGRSALASYPRSSEMHRELISVETTPPAMSEALTPSHMSSRKRSAGSQAPLAPHERPDSSMSRATMLSNAPTAAQLPTYPVALPPKQQQQHMKLSEVGDFQELKTDRSMNLDFAASETSDALDNFDFDSFLAGKHEAVEQAVEEPRPTSERGQCPDPNCRKIFKDLKAHMLTHQTARPEKCPMSTCEYNQKGFARKYDKNRHTLTHYKGTIVCAFCPGSGTAAEKSFNRVDVFKRHLVSVHGVKPTLLQASSPSKLSRYYQDTRGNCSTCSIFFSNAQDFYEHLDDCVVRVVQHEAEGHVAELPGPVSEAGEPVKKRRVAPATVPEAQFENPKTNDETESRAEQVDSESDKQQFNDAAEAASEEDRVLGRAENNLVVGREGGMEEEAEEEAHEEGEIFGEAADEIPMLEKEGTTKQAGQAVSSEPGEHTSDEDEEMIDYSDEELQAENEQRRQDETRPALTQFKGVLEQNEPASERDQRTFDNLNWHISHGGYEDVSGKGKRKGTPPDAAKPEKSREGERQVRPARDMLESNIRKTEDTDMTVDQGLNFEKGPRQQHLPRTSSAEHLEAKDGISRGSVTESLRSIVDFLERYTLLEGQDLERARTIVADA